MNQRQENPQSQQFEHFMNPQQAYYPQSSSMMTGDFYNSQQNNHYQNQPSSFNAEINVSSLPMPASELTYGNNLQQQENISVTSSPSIEFVTPNFDLYSQDQYQLVNMSSSSTEIDQSLGSFATPTITPAPIIPSHFHKNPDSSSQAASEASTPLPTPGTIVKLTPPSQPIKRTRSAKSAHMHRTLSYESVMSLSDFNVNTTTKRTNSLSPPPSSQPLDHDKVMEALRAKLRKSSSPYQAHRPRPSPEPIPPPNTNPTTGVLLLNLKSRRRKTSVTKRNSGNHHDQGNTNS
ncbi:MAG: hypothetical protein EXX96DRAFT_262391 [Benjaminiella poitrasii]|nr:MAG: hypothetical protein EXX96DRAFT_262391 [Benjaminiella poitrasii]